MINAALKIFAMQGYRHASTDDIVREAAISKGLLFHYFDSKLGVYQFIYDYSVRYMSLELRSTVNSRETDLFEILKQVETAKIQAMRGYPYMQLFLTRCGYEDVGEALLAIEDKKALLAETYQSIENQISFQNLPAIVDGVKLLKMLEFTIQGLMTERFQDHSFQPDMLLEETFAYLDMTKKMLEGH